MTRSPQPGLLNDAATYTEIKRRFEDGERKRLAHAFNVSLNTLYEWAHQHDWKLKRDAAWVEERRTRAIAMIKEGCSTSAIRAVTGMAHQTVMALRAEFPEVPPPPRAPRTPRPAAPPPPPVPFLRPPADMHGWYCSSCTWWGDDVDDYKAHKKMHEA